MEGMLRTVADERSLNHVFRLLANEQRRYVLYYLHELDDSADLETIALQVTAWQHEKPLSEVSDEELHRAMVRLRNIDLPKLSEAGIVEYDPRTEMARFREPGKLFGLFLLLAARIEQPLGAQS